MTLVDTSNSFAIGDSFGLAGTDELAFWSA
jgi:hypothetical protein